MKYFSTQRSSLIVLVILSLSLLCGMWMVSSIAQNSSANGQALGKWKIKKVGAKHFDNKIKHPEQAADPSVRIIEDQIPEHIPLKVELKNLDVEPLYRNLEVEVTNTSNKPIYFLELLVILPDVVGPPRSVTSLPLIYGRRRLIDFREPVTAEDVPLKPGESYLFKIPEDYLERLERHFAKVNFNRSLIKTIQVAFQVLNFGDMTGYTTTGGLPIPNVRSGTNKIGNCNEGEVARVSRDLTQDKQLFRPSENLLLSVVTFTLARASLLNESCSC